MKTDNTIKTTVELDATQASQEIAKLNAIASDSTKSLEERLEAKNKQVEIQNNLSKKSIEAIEKEVKKLKESGAEKSKIEKLENKLNRERVKSTKITANNAKAQNKLSQALADSKNNFKKLDEATGGVITKFKTLLSNPIGLFITAIVGAFSALKEAVIRSGKASETFNKIGSKLSGVLNGLLAILEPLVIFLGEKLLNALNDPVKAIEDLGNTIQENLINRVKSVLVFGESLVKLFKGDFKGAAKAASDAAIQLATGVENGTEKIKNLADEAKSNYEKASKATVDLSNAERRLVKNRIELEKQQLTSLRLAEEERQIRDDTSKSIDERIEANRRLGEVLDEQLQKELNLAQQTLDLALLQKSATGETIENIEAVGDAELKLLEIRERITGQRSEQLTNENSLLKEQADLKITQNEEAEKKAEEDAVKREEEEQLAREKLVTALEQQIEFDELELERFRENGEATNEIEAEIINNRAQIDINSAKRTAEEIELIEAKKENALEKLNRDSAKAEKEITQANLDNTINAAAEAFGIQQEVSLAKQLIAAPEAIGDIFKTAANAKGGIPGRILHITSGLATVLPPIAASLSAIKNARFPGGKGKRGGGAGSVATASVPSIPSTPTITPEVINDIGSNSSANLGIDTSLGDNATATAANNVSATSQGEVIFSEDRFQDFRRQVDFREDRVTIA